MKSADYDLIQAVMGGDFEEAKQALDKGANPNVRNEGGNSALILAARYGYPEIVKALLNAGADKNYTNSGGDTALSWAIANSKLDDLDDEQRNNLKKVIQILKQTKLENTSKRLWWQFWK